MTASYPSMLTIAGSDPSGGAGIQADIKTASALGVYALAIVTALTAQSTLGVRAFESASLPMLEMQLRTLLDDIRPSAVKIGMVPSEEHVLLTARLLREYELKNIVLDPVLVATSGDALSNGHTVQAILTELAPLATVITPNIPEAEALAGMSITTVEEAVAAAHSLRAGTGAGGVLVKGGHGSDLSMITDIYVALGHDERLVHRRIDTSNTHGTGCTLSSAIASYMALGLEPHAAVVRATGWLHGAIEAGARFTLGHGHGPVNHLYKNPCFKC